MYLVTPWWKLQGNCISHFRKHGSNVILLSVRWISIVTAILDFLCVLCSKIHILAKTLDATEYPDLWPFTFSGTVHDQLGRLQSTWLLPWPCAQLRQWQLGQLHIKIFNKSSNPCSLQVFIRMKVISCVCSVPSRTSSATVAGDVDVAAATIKMTVGLPCWSCHEIYL